MERKRLQLRNRRASMMINCGNPGWNGAVCITADEKQWHKYNPADWKDTKYHEYIEYHWPILRDGDLIDVQSRRFSRWKAWYLKAKATEERELLADDCEIKWHPKADGVFAAAPTVTISTLCLPEKSIN